MVTQSEANYSFNIGLHVLILFTFLTVFFFTYVSKISKENINNALKSIVKIETRKFLDEINKWDKIFNFRSTINWDEADKIANKFVKNSQNELPEITKNNTRLLWVGIIMIVSLFLLLSSMYFYYRYVLKLDINLGRIFGENIVIFSIIGIIEFIFFSQIASKYIPVTPDFVSKSVLDRIKYSINKSVL